MHSNLFYSAEPVPFPPDYKKKMDTFAYLIVLLSGAISVMAASLGVAVMPGETIVSDNLTEAIHIMNVMDDTKLRMVCVCGSIGGALLSVGLFPSRRPRLMVIKFFCSAISGIMFAPWLGSKFGIPAATDAMLGWSGLVALCSYTVIQRVVVPLVEKASRRWLGIELGVNGEEKEESDTPP